MGKVRFQRYDNLAYYTDKSDNGNYTGDYWPDADYEALEAENNELKQEIKDRAYSEKCVTKILHDALDERDDLYAALAALVEAVSGAPHNMGCSSLQGGPTTKDWGKPSRCDCWKKAAIAAAPMLLEALKSIANNTCCDKCQEAARVAKAALRREGNDEGR